MRWLALDVATQTGWAHSNGQSGFWDLSVLRDESDGMRLIRLEGKLNEIENVLGIDAVAFESAQVHTTNLSGVLVEAGLLGVLQAWCIKKKIEYKGINVSSIKKHATGKGNAKKDAMLAAARKRWPEKDITTSDEADALWLLDLITATIGAGRDLAELNQPAKKTK